MKLLIVSPAILMYILLLSSTSEKEKFIKANPAEYDHALRNPFITTL